MKNAAIELEKIINDKVHGSTELLVLIINHFIKYKDDIDYLILAAQKIKKSLSHFPSINKFIREVESILRKKNSVALNNYLIEFNKKNNKTFEKIFYNASKSLLKLNSILTISHSKTLIKVFGILKKLNPKLKIIVCESRPDNEGIIMGKEFVKMKIKTELITEAMAGNYIKKVDAVILGADQILPNGNVINKTGSRLLAILAKYHKIPVYVLANSDKIVKKKILVHYKQVDAKIFAIKNAGLKFRNENFEEIEKNLITKIFYD